MKNIFFILIILLTVSCSKDERNCSSCHIVVYQLNYPYYITELEEFCDEELLINQNNGFYISDTIFNDYYNNPLPSPISPGDTLYYHCGDSHSH